MEIEHRSTIAHDYPDDGHIYVCVRVRDVATVPGMAFGCNNNNNNNNNNNSSSSSSNITHMYTSRRSARENVREAQKICVSTMENVVVLHDPKALNDSTCVARDAESLVQFLTHRTSFKTDKHFARKFLTASATANYFDFDRCLNSMDAPSMMQMPLIRNSDFLRPPEYGSQEDVYLSTATHAVTAAVEGINSCVFAYGQTGSGKTYTLFGDTMCMHRDPGVVPRTLEDLFQRLEAIKQEYAHDSETAYSFRVQMSFFEIYQNEVYCLLSRKGPLRVNFSRDAANKRETMVIHDLQQHVVAGAEKAYPLIEVGLRRRQTGETGMNARSSRSHGILQLRVTQWRTNQKTKEAIEHNATLNLVDLAGSERQKTAKTDGKSREEGIQINQSLATLARVINEISRGAKYVSYRDSLLTMVLKDNLGGNSKTFMIATIAPVAFCYQESCATLQYARDVRKIRNRPMVNKTFQTRSNLLEFNARLKLENEQLKQHIERLLNDMPHYDMGEDRTAIRARGCDWGLIHAVPPTNDNNINPPASAFSTAASSAVTAATSAATSIAIAAPTVGGVTAPFVVTAHRVYTNVTGLGASCVKDDCLGITSLAKDIMQFRIADFIGNSVSKASQWRSGSGSVSEQQSEALQGCESDLGSVVFERVSYRSCVQRIWVRFIPPMNNATACGVECQVNGKALCAGADCRRMSHGDVICVYIEGNGDEQRLLTMHYMDINFLARRAVETSAVGDLTVSVPVLEVPKREETVVEQLRRENAKLLDILQAQARTIDYQSQREAQCSSRLGSLANNHHRHPHHPSDDSLADVRSPSPVPVFPHERIEPLESPAIALTTASLPPPTTQTDAASRTFRRSSVSLSIRDHSRDIVAELLERAAKSVSQRLDDCVQENRSLYKSVMERNATVQELAQRLAELESDDPPQRDVPSDYVSTRGLRAPKVLSDSTPSMSDEECHEMSKKEEEEEEQGEYHEEEQGEDEVGYNEEERNEEAGVDTREKMEQKEPSATTDRTTGHTGFVVSTETQTSSQKGSLTADDILRGHRANVDFEKEFGRPQLFSTTTDGVRERYYAAKRERVLCERIWSLEQTLEDLRSEMNMLESRLRIAHDANTENGLRQAQMEDEMTEVSKALLDATEENAVLLRDIASLETFLSRTEEALAAASTVNEAELEKHVAEMTKVIYGLKTVARMWKRRAMQRFAQEFGGENDGAVGEDADATPAMLSGQVPWDGLRVESNVARAKKLLGNRGCTAAAVKAIDEFEKDTAIESIVALETVLTELEHENLRLMGDVRSYEQELQGYKDLVARLRTEKEQLEKKGIHASATAGEAERLKALYVAKCAELEQAERQYGAVEAKLRVAVQKTGTVMKKSNKSNDLLLQEQRLMLAEHRGEQDKLRGALAARDEELRTVLCLLQEQKATSDVGECRAENELRERIEQKIQEAFAAYGPAPKGGYSVFPPDFQFSEEIIALIRVCLRIMMDRLKIELYVLNRQSLHKFGLLVPAVQLRPEAQFHSFMHELRGVVVEMAGKPQRFGGKWTVEEPDVLARLVDHRRRRVGNALYGLLIWYDHWDLAPKSEHVCYMELIRNTDRVMQLARLVRQESLVNTNATSTLRFVLPTRNGDPAVAYVPEASNDTSVMDGRRILKKLSTGAKRSNLARVAASSRPGSYQYGRAAVDTSETPRYSGMVALDSTPCQTASSALIEKTSHSRYNATSTRKFPPTLTSTPTTTTATTVTTTTTTATGALNTTANPGPDEAKLSRRATALVVPVSDNDVTFAATSAVAQHNADFSFTRHASAVNIRDEHPPAAAAAVVRKGSGTGIKCTNRLARSRTDIPMSFTGLAELRRPAAKASTPSRRPSGSVPSSAVAEKKQTKKPWDSSRSAVSDVLHANKAGASQASSRASGRRTTTRASIEIHPASPKPRAKFNGFPVTTVPKSFYDPCVMMLLRERSVSESNQRVPPPPLKLGDRFSTPTTTRALTRANAATCGTKPLMASVAKTTERRNSTKEVLAQFTEVPQLCFDGLRQL